MYCQCGYCQRGTPVGHCHYNVQRRAHNTGNVSAGKSWLPRLRSMQYDDHGSISISLKGLSKERLTASGLRDQDHILLFQKDRTLLFQYRLSSNRAFSFSIKTKSNSLATSSQSLGWISSTSGSLDYQLRNCTCRFIYQVARYAWHVLPESFGMDRDEMKEMAEDMIQNAHSMCIICGRQTTYDDDLLYRATTCRPSCSVVFRRSTLEVRAPELQIKRQSTAVALVCAAAMVATTNGKNSDLCPPFGSKELSRAGTVILESLGIEDWTFTKETPSTVDQLAWSAKSIEAIKKDRSTERVIAWSMTHYRGCLVSSNALNLGIDMRFHLFTGNADIEDAFAQHLNRAREDSEIVFHGTTFDRLYPIMCKGLKYDAALTQTGRAYGDGVYATNDSTTAMTYARGFVFPYDTPDLLIPWDVRVLLVCELVRPRTHIRATRNALSGQRCNIYVVEDPSQIILRAIITKHAGEWPEIDLDSLTDVIRTSKSSGNIW